MLNMSDLNESIRANCTARYLLNESSIDPISIFDRHPQCELQRKFMPNFLYVVRTFMLAWLITGLFGNFFSFIIWISKEQRRKNSSAIYLSALSLTDFILILLLLNYDLERYWCVRGVTIIPGICQIFQCLFIFTQYYSIVLVFGFTLERYLAVCFPFKRHKLCTTQRAILAVIILALFIIGPMLSQAVLWTFEKGECRMRINIAMDNRFQTLLFVQEVLFSLVIPLATLIFNILVLCEMRRLIKSSNLLKISKHHSHTTMNNNNNSDIDGNSYNTCQSLFHKRISCKNLFKSRRSTLMNVNIFPDRNGRRGSDNNTNYNRNESIGTIKLSPIRTSNINSIEQTYSKESSQFVSATLMLIILSFYLIACTVPTGIVYLIQFRWLQPDDCLNDEMILKSDEWNTFFQRIATKGLIDALCASHYACNFFIYFLTCTSFRKKALYILKCKFTTLPYQSDYVTETLILSRRTAPRSLRPLSDNNDNKGEQIDNKSLLIYNNSK